MKKNEVKAKLKRGEPSIGTWLSLPDPTAALLLANVGFDWLTLNLEHMPIGVETAALSYAAIAGAGTVPLARVAWNTGENIKRVIDNGGWGVVIPMVCTKSEAEMAVENTFYGPLGARAVGGMLHAVNFGTEPAEYYEKANDEILLVVQMEHIKAVENADEILSVPGIDAFFVGPNDLLKSMGRKPVWDSDDQAFLDALTHLKTTARKYGVASGIHVASADFAKLRSEEGFQFIAIASEAGMMLSKAQEIATALNLGSGRTVGKY
ncbi:MAG: 4-hydroxy-2-oxo-heptane-1,7-dioate aldolase [Verrucomicrobia subdivision 3 bacterium]|nr:4-hydroxy-2-oxo-heptane-1,7-dioate aldolase [Limisphaerales bacterium]MCS1412531.1 4-hydroxy-2-oxo-heptane-1,7-dioate aldolase [Limisphaerales bacterium]